MSTATKYYVEIKALSGTKFIRVHAPDTPVCHDFVEVKVDIALHIHGPFLTLPDCAAWVRRNYRPHDTYRVIMVTEPTSEAPTSGWWKLAAQSREGE